MDSNDVAEQRANAVARLRRAASLPRMKDGRRPHVPMHGEAGGVSEGEKGQGDDKDQKDEKNVENVEDGIQDAKVVGDVVTEAATETPEETPDVEPVMAAILEAAMSADASTVSTPAKEEAIVEPTPPPESEPEPALDDNANITANAKSGDTNTTATSTKRRSRSRSRSRTSRDMRAKLRALEASGISAGEASGPDDVPSPSADSPPLASPALPPLSASPIPGFTAVAGHSQQPFVMSPLLASPLAPFGFPFGASPPSAPHQGAGLMPSLEALQNRHLQGLFRSNSAAAAARMMAMSKLTGEPLDLGLAQAGVPSSATPESSASPTPGNRLRLGGLTRNNTVAGEERVAARQQLLRRLHDRIQEKERNVEGFAAADASTDAETATNTGVSSGGEDIGTSKGRRRRRRKSTSTVVDDRDREYVANAIASANANSPSPAPTPVPPMIMPEQIFQRPYSPALQPLPPSRAPSVPPEQFRRTPDPLGHLRQGAPSPHPTFLRARTPDLRTPTPTATSAAPFTVPGLPSPSTVVNNHPEITENYAQASNHYQYDSPILRRGLVVEEEDPEDVPAPTPLRTPPTRGSSLRALAGAGARAPGLPTPPSHGHTPVQHSHSLSESAGTAMRMPHASDAPSLLSLSSTASFDTGGHNVPFILSPSPSGATRNPYRQDVFPKSPFGTPVKERSLPTLPREDETQDQEERVVLYDYEGADNTRSRFPRGVSEVSGMTLGDREISWDAEPVPVIRRRLFEPEDREISWIADAVPEARFGIKAERDVSWVTEPSIAGRMPVYDEDEDEEDGEEAKEVQAEVIPPPRPRSASRSRSRRTSPRDSAESQEEIVVERDPDDAQDSTPAYSTVPSQHSTTSTATMNTFARESISAVSDSGNSVAYALRASDSALGDTNSQLLDRTLSQADSQLEENWSELHHGVDGVGGVPQAPGLATKRSADSSSASTWSKVKGAFMRSGSSLGRRSRTNSIARDKKDGRDAAATESSRESAASLSQLSASNKRESRGGDRNSGASPGSAVQVWQQNQTPLLSPSPSASSAMLPLSAPPPPRSGVSPIPPPSDADTAKYKDPKLFPFPGMVRLQEENLRRGMNASASSPEIALQSSTSGGVMAPSMSSSASGQTVENSMRERKLSHQASDSRLLPRYQTPVPAVSGAPSSASQLDYFNVQQPQPTANASMSLPFTREGVKRWLSVRRLFPSTSQQGASPSPPLDSKVHAETIKKPSLSDLLGRKDIENISDWDDIEKSPDKPRAQTSLSTNIIREGPNVDADTDLEMRRTVSRDPAFDFDIPESSPDDPVMAYTYPNEPPQASQTIDAHDVDTYVGHNSRHLSAPLSSSHEPSSATPEPASSEESTASSQRSESSIGSLYSPEENPRESAQSAQAADILQRLDQVLHADSRNMLWTNTLNTPPRRLLLSSPMLQVANCNTVKDRFLFLFSDILVIAKPMLPDRDSLIDNQKLYPPDRKFFIKNVVHLKDIRLNVDRDEDSNRATSSLISQRPEFIRDFIREFSENPDTAVARIVDVRDQKGFITLGRLLAQLPEIDRAKLGEYLSRRTSKHVLRAFIDAFGFAGMNIDIALRIFLLSMHIPSGSGHANTLETLLDTFAGRWYEANAGIVAFDRDLAIRLVRAIVRLNEALHAPIAQESASSLYSRPYVASRDFTEAFRRHDPRVLVPDMTLEKIYASVRQEKLCQARNPTNGRAPSFVTLKRPIPSHVTYRRQSEPIVIRVPLVDPQLTISLHGQDLVFDPPILTFAKSTEASFRVTGNSLGLKTLVIACSGPNAPNYTGLPLSTTINVERAFMRNTFQIAFNNHIDVKRKYMFSVDDPVIRHEWTGSLKRQIEAAKAGQGSSPQLPTNVQAQVYRAAEALSFKVLQETLMNPNASTPNGTLRRSTTHERGVSDVSQQSNLTQNGTSLGDIYQRSRSRSQTYRLGAGKHEYDTSNGVDDRHITSLEIPDDLQLPDLKAWTGSELELLCQQNSSIALVLSFLQAALPFDVDDEMNSAYQFPSPSMHRTVSQSSPYQI